MNVLPSNHYTHTHAFEVRRTNIICNRYCWHPYSYVCVFVCAERHADIAWLALAGSNNNKCDAHITHTHRAPHIRRNHIKSVCECAIFLTFVKNRIGLYRFVPFCFLSLSPSFSHSLCPLMCFSECFGFHRSALRSGRWQPPLTVLISRIQKQKQ